MPPPTPLARPERRSLEGDAPARRGIRAELRAFAVLSIVAAGAFLLIRSDEPTVASSVPTIVRAPGASETLRVGEPAPVFAWRAEGARERSLVDLRGRVVVVNFWATWCPSCREEMPALDRVAASDPEVTVLAVDLHQEEGFVLAYLRRLQLPHLVPVIDVDGETARRYGFAALPATYFVDPAGVLRHVRLGPMDEAAIREGIAAARGR